MRRIASYLLFLFAAVTLFGCGNESKTAGMNQAVTDFNSGRYAQSREAATAAMSASNGPAKDDAAYLAGLSAYQLGDTDEAERRWLASVNSSNKQTAANSKAMLGQLRLDQGRYAEAGQLLADASANFEGDNSRQAAHRAGIAFQKAGDDANARKWLAIGGQTHSTNSSATSSAKPNAKAALAANISPNGYTLQVGAFNEIKRARRAAEDADRLAKKQNMGSVRMFSKTDERGRRFFIVQLGHFLTRDEATAARSKLGKLEYIVAPAAPRTEGYASAG